MAARGIKFDDICIVQPIVLGVKCTRRRTLSWVSGGSADIDAALGINRHRIAVEVVLTFTSSAIS